MKKILFWAIFISVVAVGIGVYFLSQQQMMHTEPPEKIVPIMANQNLRFFKVSYDSFRYKHGRPPGDIQELLADGSYLKGVVGYARPMLLDETIFPVPVSQEKIDSSAVLAIFRVAGYGDFFLLDNDHVVERRLKDYNQDTYYKIQNEKLKSWQGEQTQH